MSIGCRVDCSLDDMRLAIISCHFAVADEVPDALEDNLEDVESREGEASREGVKVQRRVLGAEDLASYDGSDIGTHNDQPLKKKKKKELAIVDIR